MKKNLLLGVLVLSVSSLGTAAKADDLRSDCEVQIKAMVAVAAGEMPWELGTDEESFNAQMAQGVTISDVKKISSHPTAGAPSITSSAKVEGLGLQGTVRVQATRGGCFIQRVNLSEKKN